jgi:hypothetical protein
MNQLSGCPTTQVQSERAGAEAELGYTRFELPLGGIASSVPEHVRAPAIRTFTLLMAVAAMLLSALISIRLLIW